MVNYPNFMNIVGFSKYKRSSLYTDTNTSRRTTTTHTQINTYVKTLKWSKLERSGERERES